jgi:hypothetical protein
MEQTPTAAPASPRAEIDARLSLAEMALAEAERALGALPSDDASLVRRADETAAIETARFLMTRAAGVESLEAAAGETTRCEGLAAAILERLAALSRPGK